MAIYIKLEDAVEAFKKAETVHSIPHFSAVISSFSRKISVNIRSSSHIAIFIYHRPLKFVSRNKHNDPMIKL